MTCQGGSNFIVRAQDHSHCITKSSEPAAAGAGRGEAKRTGIVILGPETMGRRLVVG
jgi:hypothetical protein